MTAKRISIPDLLRDELPPDGWRECAHQWKWHQKMSGGYVECTRCNYTPDRIITALQAEAAHMRDEADEDDALRARLSSLLTRTANALKGEPGPLMLHDWSDLPDVAARAIDALRLLGVDFQPTTKSVAKRIAAQRGEP